MPSRAVKHVVPFIRIGSSQGCVARNHLKDSIETLKTQLNLKYKNNFPTLQKDSAKVDFEADITVVPDTSKTVMFPEVTSIGKYKFDPSKYPIPEKELSNAPYEFPDSIIPLVSKETPLCTNYKQLKGVNNDLYVVGQLKGIGKKKPVYKCEWFSLTYWHSSSYFGQITKSKPGVMVQCHNINVFNSKTPITGEVPSIILNRSYPFKYAVYRTRMKKLLREKFLNMFLQIDKLNQNYTGLFRFYSYLYPESKDDVKGFEEHLSRALQRVSKLDLEELSVESEQINARIPWYDVNRILSRNGITNFGLKRQIKKQSYKNRKKL